MRRATMATEKRDDQEAREMVRADIDRVEVQREREHHHGVLRAGRERDDHVGDAKRQEASTTTARSTPRPATATANEPKAAPR